MAEVFNRYAGEVRTRIIYELRRYFSALPKWRNITDNIIRAMPIISPLGKKRIYPSEGIIVTNVSASMVRLSPDNTVGNLFSHVKKIDHIGNKRGLFLDWVEEDTVNILRKSTEDVTITATGSKLTLSETPVVNPRNGEVTYNPNHVEVLLDGSRIFPSELDGRTGELGFDFNLPGGQYIAKYWHRNMEDIGVYRIEITKKFSEPNEPERDPEVDVPPAEQKNFEFYIDPIIKRDEILTDSLSGTSVFQLPCPVLEVTVGSGVTGYALEVFMDRSIRLIPGEDYLFDPDTNEITVLVPPVLDGGEITASYRSAIEERGPFTGTENTYNNQALRGIILAFGDQIEIGDQAFVDVTDTRLLAARVKGALWQISMDFQVFSKDPSRQIELTKLLHQFLELNLRPDLSFEGIEIEEVSFGGESTETYLDVTQDPYFIGSISLNCKSFWEQRFPIYGSFIQIFPDMFYIIDPTREFFFVERPDGIDDKIPLGPPEPVLPKNYPAFSGRTRDPEREIPKKTANNLNPKTIRRPHINDDLVGFI